MGTKVSMQRRETGTRHVCGRDSKVGSLKQGGFKIQPFRLGVGLNSTVGGPSPTVERRDVRSPNA